MFLTIITCAYSCQYFQIFNWKKQSNLPLCFADKKNRNVSSNFILFERNVKDSVSKEWKRMKLWKTADPLVYILFNRLVLVFALLKVASSMTCNIYHIFTHITNNTPDILLMLVALLPSYLCSYVFYSCTLCGLRILPTFTQMNHIYMTRQIHSVNYVFLYF